MCSVTALRFAALITLMVAALAAADDAEPTPRGEMFDRVVEVLGERFYDLRIRTKVIPQLAERYRERAHNAVTLNDERQVVEQMLAHIPASHLGLLSRAAHEQMMRNLAGESAPTLGMELVQVEGDYFVVGLWEGGPAEAAGVKRGDRVLRIDDQIPSRSPRLDWRSDDAALADPPMHALLCAAGESVTLRLERTLGERIDVRVEARDYSALQAARASAEVVDIGGRKVAYIHFWFIHTRGMDTMLARLAVNQFKDAEAMVLDLRGRGGSAAMVTHVLKVLYGRDSDWRKPVVALIDNQTRSAKEMLAWELKKRKLGVLVGQTTAGALLPAAFAKVGADSVLMYPAFPLGEYTQAIEGKGVAPDVEVESPLPHSAGADPIRDRGMQKAAELAARSAASTQPVP